MRAIFAAIAAILNSIMESFIGRWCSKSGRWVYDRVLKPVGGASVGAAQFVGDHAPGVARAGARGLEHVLDGGGRLTASTLAAIAAVPGFVAGALGGGGGRMPMPPASGGQEVADVKSALSDVEARRRARAALREMQSQAPVSLEAGFVHRYARAGSVARECMDLEELPPHLQEWLLSLNERQLAHLAQSPAICEEAVAGRRTGLVGMPRPEEAAPARSGRMSASVTAIGDRIARAKGYRDAMVH